MLIPGLALQAAGSSSALPFCLEMKVDYPDGHVLRFGSEPRADKLEADQRSPAVR